MVYAHILFTNGFFEPKSPIFLDIIKKIAKMHGTYFEQFCKAEIIPSWIYFIHFFSKQMFKGLKSTKKMPAFNSNSFGIRKFIKLNSYISTLEGPRASAVGICILCSNGYGANIEILIG